jgi:circadian clock protein KaiB
MKRSRGDLRDDDIRNPDAYPDQRLREFEQLVSDLSPPKYVFRLYVAGNTMRSTQAVTNVRRICEQYLAGFYELEVIDVYQSPGATKEADIIALPTLIKELPLPPKRFIGDMSDEERIVVGLKLGK